MRIVHLSYNIPSPQFDDPEVWLKRITFSTGVLESMSQYAEVIGIFNINFRGIVDKNRVVYHFPNYSKWQLRFPFQFNHYVKKLYPDVVIVHGLIFPWQVILLRYHVGAHVKIIAQHHAERPLRDFRQYLQQWADRYIKAYLFASADLGRLWVDRRQIRNSKKIKVVMGSSSPFIPMNRREAWRITKVEGEKIFLWVGCLDSNKDPLTVVKAFAGLAKKNYLVRLYMIYQTYQLLEELQTLILQLGVSRSVFLVGKVENPDLKYWYNSVQYIISSSHYEGSGIAVCEAMSCGCIPIVTNIPSFRMMTDHGRVGLLYGAGDVQALLNSLTKALEMNIEQEKEKVLEQFKAELSFDANSRKIMNVINDLI